MTSFDLLSILSGIGFFTALIEGQKGGVLGTLTGFAAGVVVSFIFIAGWRFGGAWIIQRMRLGETNLSPFRLILSWLFLVAAILWIALGGFLGSWITKSILHVGQAPVALLTNSLPPQ